jgi:UDP-glucuronate decarboxylase
LIKKILITGGAGNIGGSLARRLVRSNNYTVTIVDNLLTGSVTKLPDDNDHNWKFIKADVNEYRDIAPIMLSESFNFVFHYAAVVGVRRTLENPVMVLKDIHGLENIMSLSKNTGVERVFFSSSSEIYGEPYTLPQQESTTPLNSRLPYAIVKNVAEAFCKSYNLEFGLDYTIFRFFNTYGPLQSKDFVISRFIECAINNQDIAIHGDGSQTRTFCYIDDNLDATISALENKHWINDVVNIGSDIEISILELAKLVIKIFKSNSQIVFLPKRNEGDMSRRKPDISKMRLFVSKDLKTLEEGIYLTAKQMGYVLP